MRLRSLCIFAIAALGLGLQACANVNPTITMASVANDDGNDPVSTTPTVGRVVPLAGVGTAGGLKLRSRVSYKTEEQTLTDTSSKYVLKGSATMRSF